MLVPKDGPSMLIEYAYQLLINAEHTLKMVTVPLATRDMTSLTDNVFTLYLIMFNLWTLDVLPGTGTSKSALPAPMDGFSTTKEYVLLFLTNVLLMLKMVTVQLVIKDTIWLKDNASSLNQTTPDHLILDALPGTGTSKSALPAPTDGSSTPKEFVFLFPTSVLLTLKMVTVPHATRDTTSLTDNASSLNQTTPSHLTLDVLPGTGTSKSALPAPTDGSSMPKEFVLLSLISAKPTLKMVTVLLVTKVMILKKVSVFSLISTMLDLQILDVLHGIGKIKNALPVQTDGSSTHKEDVSLLMTTVTTMLMMAHAHHATLDTQSEEEFVSQSTLFARL